MFRQILLVALAASTGCVAIAQNQYKVMAIGFYNCEKLFYPTHDSNKKDEDFTPNGAYHYTEEIYKQKVHNIATVIGKMGTEITPDGPAIIGMAEVENDLVLKDLVEDPEIKSRHYKYAWFYTPDERGISTALLYNPKYLTVLNAEPLHVATEKLPQKRATRDILHVYGVLAGDTVHILVNYWPSKTGEGASSASGRLLAASVARRVIDSLDRINPETKIFILGDLNDNPTSEPIVDVLDAKADKDHVKLTGIYNPWADMYKKGLGTAYYMGDWNLTDQIMISGAFLKNNNNKWKYYKAEIYSKDFLTNKTGHYKGFPHKSFTAAHEWDNGYSDHFPVLLYMIEKKG